MPEFPETDHSLIDRARDTTDEASWLEFVRIYQPVVYRLARKREMQDADSHDVVQQVFASIARSLGRWHAGEGQPPFRAWLCTIARNAISTTLTRRRPDQGSGSSSVADALEELPSAQPTDAELLMEARREIVRWAAEQIRPEFSEQTWSIFWQTAMQQVPVVEVAKSYGKSIGAIYVSRHRVVTRLKEKIAELSHHWEPR